MLYKKFRSIVFLFGILMVLLSSCKDKLGSESDVSEASKTVAETSSVHFVNDDTEKKVDVNIDGELFTSYRYDAQTPKPILYPLIAKSGKTITRGFPFEPRPNERVDHPHHVGLWFNYGDVNGFDFWNNSDAIPEEKKHRYGYIVHQEVLESDDASGILKIKAVWRSPLDADLLEEVTEFNFFSEGESTGIDRITTLKALVDVSFKDNKEGMMGIRVAKELELPTDKPAVYTDAEGNVTEVEALNEEGVSGNYFASEGLTGNEVWGTRNKWVKLEGIIEGDTVSITILDHKKNLGYPTYWHARDYGLFAANPSGQAIFSEGKTALNFKMKKGESSTFRYRILVHNGSTISKEMLNQSFLDFNE